jgi:hypothetical protein
MNRCCEVSANLEPKPEHPDARPPDLTVTVCRVCGARHFTLGIDPGAIGVQGAGL